MTNSKEYVFGLDIGTRSIVGTVGYQERADYFRVVSQVAIEHETRAVIDGQIHDIPVVVKTIKRIKEQLEEMIGSDLSDVCIAAAGRVLKTRKIKVTHEFPSEVRVTDEHVRMIDMLGVEKAYEMIREEEGEESGHFYCVGFTTVGYYLNDYGMEKIEMHKAKTIGVELIATFLPDEVVEGLYTAVEEAGLIVSNLTLEPIAAINVAIPEKFRLLNIALVDIGAGTSDISIVKDGSIVAFGMMPLAGDEITEAIAREYLIDFQSAEDVKKMISQKKQVMIKNIMGETFKVSPTEVLEVIEDTVSDIAQKIAEKIVELNGGKCVSAVFVVGGGGKLEGFIEKLAQHIGLPGNRVALRGAEVLQNITFVQEEIQKDSTLVTPIGICLSYYDQSNSFIHVTVNGEQVKMYDNNTLTVLDAALQIGFNQEDLFPTRGESFSYILNGQERDVRGMFGEPASILLNNEHVSLNVKIKDKDKIQIEKAVTGKDGHMSIGELREYKRELVFSIYGKKVICPPKAMVNDEQVSSEYDIKPEDRVELLGYYTMKEALEFCGLELAESFLVNGESRGLSDKIYDGDTIEEAPPVMTVEGEIVEKETAAKETVTERAVAADTSLEEVAGTSEENFQTESPIQSSGLFGRSRSVDNRITVNVNGTAVTLEDKPNHIFVEVFDVYPFDLSKAGGKRLISKVNGVSVDFTQPISQGDDIELVWGD